VGEPSPLIFHLGAPLAAYLFALLAAPRSDSPDFPWADGLGADAAALGGGLDRLEVAREIAARLSATVRGLEIWQAHPYRRTLADPPAVWEAGCSRLLDYGAAPEAAAPDGPPVLVVPSLINRAYVLDLVRGRSMLRWLAAQGLRPLLLDWGTPGGAEAGFDLGAYGRERLLPALGRARALAGGPVPVMGYCMGGTLAVGLAARRPEDVAALVTIGAPWDFASTAGIVGSFRGMMRAEGAAQAERLLDGLGAAFGLVPVSLLQAVFALVNPIQASLKFQKLARLDPDGPAARVFVALEDWLSDGVPMPAGAAKDLLVGWQVRNRTAAGTWRFLGGPVDPRRAAAPALVVCGERDTIAPPPLARPLGALLPRATTLQPRTGHVGMVVGSGARAQVWRPVADFLSAHLG
jgi:polyhydroxyalkanoate synthase